MDSKKGPGSTLSSLLARLGLHHLGDGVRSLVPYAAAGLLLLALQRSPINETLNLLLYDLITSLRQAPSGTDKPITIIGIDESDLATYGFPIDDKVLCEAIDRLNAAGAVAIGLDIYRDQGVGPDQACLRERFRTNPRLVSIINVAEAIGPVPGTPADQRGFNDLVLDADGVLRRDLVHVAGQDDATVALPLRLLEVGKGQRSLRQRLEKGSEPGPWLLEAAPGGYDQLDARGFQQMLSFHKIGSFHLWNLQDVLGRRPIPRDQIRGHIVLIGSTARSLRDIFPVPQTRFVLGANQLLVPGVEIHAHRLAALMDRDVAGDPRRMRTLPGWVEGVAEVLAAVLGIVLGEAFKLLRRSVLVVLLVAALMVGGAVLLLYNFVWVGLSLPLTGFIAMAGAAWVRRGASSQKQRQQIERLLGQTTSPAVARQLWNQRDGLLSDGRFEGRQLPVTVLMLDTCSFTSVAERLTPGELLDWLNRGMALFVPAVTRRGGMVNKFTGDGLLAVFGAPLSSGEQADAKAAIDAALAIQRAVVSLNGELEKEVLPAMALRIGVHSGAVLAGSLGSSERLEYAVIGDAVNCAARLESIDKERQTNLCRVLVSSSTLDLLPKGLPLEWLDWGEMNVKGRTEPLRIWELSGSLRRDSALESAPATGP
jgi:adenylate cyclase